MTGRKRWPQGVRAARWGLGRSTLLPSSSCVDGHPAVGTKVEVLALLALLSQTE